MGVTQQGSARVFFRDVKPYDVPADLNELRGPAAGELVLPHHVYWGPQKNVDLNTVGGLLKAYQAIIREGSAVDQAQLLNRDLLIRIWGDLTLPTRVRDLWESRFLELSSITV